MKRLSWHQPSLLRKDHPIAPWLHLQNVIIPTALAIASAVASLVAESSIVGDLGIEGSLSPWISTLYLLGINTIVPVSNRIADRIGYKKMYCIAISLFTLGSLGSALAIDFYTLGLARLIEGIGGGIIFPVGMAIIAQTFPKEKFSLAINIYMCFGFGFGFAIGTFVSGYLSMHYLWQSIFYALIPNGVIALIICILFQHETERVGRGKFDLWGYLSFISFIAFLLIALAEGNLKSTAEGWRSPFIIGCFSLAFIGLILALIIEKKAENPIIPLGLFKDPLFSVGCLTLFALGMAIFSSASFMITYMEIGLKYDKWQAGLNATTYGLAIGIFSMLSNIFVKKISANILSIIGLTIVIFSYFLNDILTIQSGKVAIFTILFVRGMGVALALGPVTVQSLAYLPKKYLTDGSTLLTFFRQVGGSYGGSILSIIIIRRNIFHTARFSEPVNPSLPGYQYTMKKLQTHIENASGSSPAEAALQAKEIIIENIKTQSYIQSINDAYYLLGCATIVITAILVFLKIFLYLKHKKEAIKLS